MLLPQYITYTDEPFIDPNHALDEPEGLLAIGGDLSTQRLLNAYRHGIFPWFNEADPILWWSPPIRTILVPHKFKLRRSFKKSLKKPFVITADTSFQTVIQRCSASRKDQQGTWITSSMIEAYCQLHQLGYAHSIEVWLNNKLVGGLYGVSLGHAFFGESMFHLHTDASKIALFALTQLPQPLQFDFIDCQMPTPHLHSLGAGNIERAKFLQCLSDTLKHDDLTGNWLFDPINSIELR